MAGLTLAEFLTARIAEDEAAARFMMDREAAGLQPRADFLGFPLGERILREVEAKRKILAEAQAVRKLLDLTGGEHDRYRDWVLRHLAAVYSEHPDFDPAWKET